MNTKILTNKQISELVCHEKWFEIYNKVHDAVSKPVHCKVETQVWDKVWVLVENNVATLVKDQLREKYDQNQLRE